MIATWREGWKVVDSHIIDGHPVSMTCAAREVYYAFGSAVVRPARCGPLAVFVRDAYAIDFVRLLASVNGERIFDQATVIKCIYAPSVDRKLWVESSGVRCESEADELPIGTDFADAVILMGTRYSVAPRNPIQKFGVPRWINALPFIATDKEDA